MSECVRFEVYVPLYYRILLLDPETQQTREETRSTDQDEIQAFVDDTLAKFHGATQSNPLAPAPYRGLWRAKGIVDVDFLAYMFGLVKLERADEALQHFETWKQRMEKDLNQDLILVIYQSVHILGELP